MGVKPHLDFGDTSPENSLMHKEGNSDTEIKPDFSGWATRANLQCSDGRTIMPDAFKHQDQAQVPMVWQHGHDEATNVLGHMVLENRDEGVYAYGYFNDTPAAVHAKTLVEHGDIKSLSIFANKLVEKAKQVSHGIIREVSLVLAGANPGALIDNIELQHADGDVVTIEDEAVIYTGETLKHGDGTEIEDDSDDDEDGPTVQHVYDEMSDEQKQVVHMMVGAALESASDTDEDDKKVTHSGTAGNDDNKEGARTMKRNVFESQTPGSGSGDAKHELSHDDIRGIAADAVRLGSMKEAVEGYALKHGIDNIDILFPDAKTVQGPEWDARRVEWVKSVLSGTKKSPFSRIKSIVADITHDEARARGYIKGNFKKEEFFGLVKRVTTPTTVYKKQKLDRDDVIDIQDLDVVAWLKGEMRLMLDEEIARAVLIGDGRAIDSDDKIRDPQGATEGAGIRSILHDHDLYAAKLDVPFDLATSDPADIVDEIITHMGVYKGSGSPTFYTTLPVLTKLLLAKDGFGRRLYRTQSDLASEMQVASIQTVEAMESEVDLLGIIVNLQDYTLGADRGGDIAMFDDFDIDFNQHKYLIETRLSGCLTKIRSAIVLRKVATSNTLRTPAKPAFDASTGVITIPSGQTGVTYKRADTDATVAQGSTVTVAEGNSLEIYTVATSGNRLSPNTRDTRWLFNHRGPLTGRDAGQDNS